MKKIYLLFAALFFVISIGACTTETKIQTSSAMKTKQEKYMYLIKDKYVGFNWDYSARKLAREKGLSGRGLNTGIAFRHFIVYKVLPLKMGEKYTAHYSYLAYSTYYTDLERVKIFNKKFKQMLEREFKTTGFEKKYSFLERINISNIEKLNSKQGFLDEMFKVIRNKYKKRIIRVYMHPQNNPEKETIIPIDPTQKETTREKIQLILKTFYPFEGIGYIDPKLGKKWFDQKKTFLTPEDTKELMNYKDDPDTYFKVHNLN